LVNSLRGKKGEEGKKKKKGGEKNKEKKTVSFNVISALPSMKKKAKKGGEREEKRKGGKFVVYFQGHTRCINPPLKKKGKEK